MSESFGETFLGRVVFRGDLLGRLPIEPPGSLGLGFYHVLTDGVGVGDNCPHCEASAGRNPDVLPLCAIAESITGNQSIRAYLLDGPARILQRRGASDHANSGRISLARYGVRFVAI